MLVFFLFSIVIIFVVVVAYLLLEGNSEFYEELEKEDKKEIEAILKDENNKNDRFKIISKEEEKSIL